MKNISIDLITKIMMVIVVGWIGLFLFLSLRQHWGLKTQMDDLGNMSQPLWNTLQGRFMEYSNTADYQGIYASRFAGHTNYIFLLLVPFYWLWSDPQILLIFQVVLVGLGALPLYWIGRLYFKKTKWLALVAPIVFLINPSLQDAVLYDMHAIVIAIPLLFFAIYFLLNKKLKLFTLFAILFVLCKEDTALIMAMVGIWYYFNSRNLKLAIVIFFSSVIFFGLNLGVIMPSFQDTRGNVLISERYGHLGGSVDGILFTALTRPQIIISDFLDKGLLGYIWKLGLGFGFVSFGSVIAILALPTLAINLLSDNPITSQPYGYYYTAPIVAALALGLIDTLARWKKTWLGLKPEQAGIGVAVVALLNFWWYSPVPFTRSATWSEFQITPATQSLEEVKQIIPTSASLTVQNNLGPHFVNRRDIVRFPYRVDQSDYIILLLEEPYGVIKAEPRQRNFVHLSQLFPQDYYDQVIGLFETSDLGVVYYQNGLYVFGRGSSTELNQEAFADFYTRAQTVFGPYESIHPVNYYTPNFSLDSQI